MRLPSHIHHFSWHTKVSLELPIGFEEEEEDPTENMAIYADDLEEDTIGARVLTKASAIPAGSDDAYLQMAAASARVAGRALQEPPEASTVDGLPAVHQTLRYVQDDLGMEIVRYETFAQISDIVFSITGVAPAESAEHYLPVFEHASSSARFILL